MDLAQNHLFSDICSIIENGRRQAYAEVSRLMIETYWKIGQRIVEEEQKGNKRAEYGAQLIDALSTELTHKYGKGFSKRNLAYFRTFYQIFPDIEILQSRLQNLTWTHLTKVFRVEDPVAIRWYLTEAAREMWSVRTLDRNISTQYYERHYQQPSLPESHPENTSTNKLELFKSPLIAEFLGFKQDSSYSENALEAAIISHLQEFMLELGRGFAFMARQQLIRTDTQDYYIDLVFYNVVLKCYVLIDLKVGTITHQDVGQMDMYVRMYDELKRTDGDNPTIGIILCSETSKDIARYSVLKGNEQLFATKYKLYLPSEEELKAEIDRQKSLFAMQHLENLPNDNH
jgi:predicted nuclease of restriction endonuclease-like (RecB) superfamily